MWHSLAMRDDLLARALAWLADNPDSSAQTIAAAIGAGDRAVFSVLDDASYDGRCQRTQYGANSPWLWEVPQPYVAKVKA
jgi:hypothetical protein